MNKKARWLILIMAMLVVAKGLLSEAGFWTGIGQFLITVEGVTVVLFSLGIWLWSKPDGR